jgi:ankyrin repeat protein
MIAAAENRGKLVDALIEAGADPNARNSKDETASGFASKKGHSKILALLEDAGVKVDRSSKKLQDAILVQAAEGKNLAEVKKALASGATADATSEKGGSTPLMTAALEGHAGMVKTLLDAGADVNRVSKWGQAPLRNAVVRGHVDVVRLLLEAGADPNLAYEPASIPAEKQNTVYPSMDSPLADAANFGHGEILDALIEAGADVNRVSKSGTTPLLAAVWGRQFDLARRLIAAGAQRREEDEDYVAVLDWEANAQAEAFQTSIREVAEACGNKPEPVDWLPGGVSFRFTVPERKEETKATADAATAALHWSKRFNEEYGSLAKLVDEVLGELATRIDARGYHLLDAGIPLGCGPMTRFMVLAPTNNKYAIMGAFGVRGNDMELTNQDIIKWFRDFETKVPFKLRGCKFDTVIIELEKPLPNPKKWAKKLCEFCPDSFYSDSGECDEPDDVVEALRTATKLHFWWD